VHLLVRDLQVRSLPRERIFTEALPKELDADRVARCNMGRPAHTSDPLSRVSRAPFLRQGGDADFEFACVQSPVGITVLPSIMSMTVRSGDFVRCTTPFGTVKPCWENSSTERSSRSIINFPETT